MRMRTFGLCRTSWLTAAQAAATRSTAGSSSTTSTRSIDRTAPDPPALRPGPGAVPAGRASGAEADDEGAARIAVEHRPHQARHHLRPSVAARAAVDLAVDDEGEVARVDQRHARLAAVCVPDQVPPLAVGPFADGVRRV